MRVLTLGTLLTLIISFLHLGNGAQMAGTKPTPTPSFSCNYDLRLSDALKKLQNQTAVNMLKQNCAWLMDSFTTNFDGHDNLVFLTAGAGCGSCREQTLHILSGSKIIFEKILDDPQVSTHTVNGQTALVIRQPIRKHNETYGDPSEWDEVTYVWFEGTFVHYDEQTGLYPTIMP